MSILRPPHREHTNRSRQSRTGVSAPYRGNHLGGVRLDLVAACLAPHDQPHLRVRRVAERQRIRARPEHIKNTTTHPVLTGEGGCSVTDASGPYGTKDSMAERRGF